MNAQIDQFLKEAGVSSIDGVNSAIDPSHATVKAIFRAFLDVLSNAGLLPPDKRREAWVKLATALDTEPGLEGFSLGTYIVKISDFDRTVKMEK